MAKESNFLKERYATYYDRFQRFQAVADLVHGLSTGPGLKILDVGSFDEEFAKFLPTHQIRPWNKKILSGTEQLPFRDDFFDAVVALDVLEHVPSQERPYFIKEVARVARKALILSFPVKQAEEVEQFVLNMTGNMWLAEHREHGLPDPEEMEKILDSLNLEYTRHPNACLASWMSMQLTMHRLRGDLKDKVSDFFNRNFYELENREPAYRAIYLCTPMCS